jgi:isocitrate dehydrogenase (NAD+)
VYCKSVLLFARYAGVPVDFEVVQMDPKSESNEDLEYAITSIRRNGVAIKGNLIQVICRLC